MSEPYLGQIYLVGYNFAQRGFALCQGQLLPISQNSALFSLLGTYYGGDGVTTFALPDLQGRTAIGMGRGPGLSDRRIGEKSGVETTTLTTLNMPSHNHTATSTLFGETAAATGNNPTGQMLGLSQIYAADGAGPNRAMSAAAVTTAVGDNGANQPFNNMQPYLVLNYEIALMGLYPSRN